MKKILAILLVLSLGLFCSKSDDSGLLIPLTTSGQVQSTSGVPSSDLVPDSGSTDLGSVSTVTGSSKPGSVTGSSEPKPPTVTEPSGDDNTTVTISGDTYFSITGSSYSSITGSWMKDGDVIITYDKDNSATYNISNVQPGNYTVSLYVGFWTKNESTQSLPSGYDTYKVLVSVNGTIKEVDIDVKTGEASVDVNVSSPNVVLIVQWLNQGCGQESVSKSKDSKSKDSKSKDSKSKDSKSKDSKSKDGKSLVCHEPGGKKTLSISESAVQAHLNHGDVRGACMVCANFTIKKIILSKNGEATIAAYISGAVGGRSKFVAMIIILIGSIGLIGTRLLNKE